MDKQTIIIGTPFVGKTSWLNKVVKNIFKEDYIKTVESNTFNINYQAYHLTCTDVVSSQIDTYIDQEIYHGVFIMCEMNSNDLVDITRWKSKLHANTKTVLIINKLDNDEEEDIDFDSFCKENNIDAFVGISVKTDHNTFEPLNKMITLLQDNNGFVQNASDQFIQKLMTMTEQCNNSNAHKFKIGYISLLCRQQHVNLNVNQLTASINEIALKTEPIDDLLNYLISLYKINIKN